VSAPRPNGSRLALIHGYSLPEGKEPVAGKMVEVDAGGERSVQAIDAGDVVAIPRHRFDLSVPAHLVDHHANIRAACELGCDRVLALGSTGSLRKDWAVGTLVCPDDFYAPHAAPSFYDDARGHSVAGFDQEWRERVASAWGSLTETPLVDGGVYAQTRGPRFETRAEIRALASVADLVGMTIASEAIIAGEASLRHAAVCTVDNLANGIEDEPLSLEALESARWRTGKIVLAALEKVLPALAGEKAEG
jgi:5'-methylthioinosine phosphorylase